MNSLEYFETVTYPRLWHLAYEAGEQARKNGLLRICNLEGQMHCHDGNILKVYKSAWEQGWDGYKIPAEFAKAEAFINQMPLRSLKESDL